MQVGDPFLSGIAVDGPEIDAAAEDLLSAQTHSGLQKALACGAAGPAWSPLDAFMAAGFRKFTTRKPLSTVPHGMEGLYETHCYPDEGSSLDIQIPVVPGQSIRIVLHFAEVYHEETGSREFDVLVNGVPEVRMHSRRLVDDCTHIVCYSTCMSAH